MAVILRSIVSISLLLIFTSQVSLAQETQTPGEDEAQPVQQFGGPGSVPGQLADDARNTESLTGRTLNEDYFDWKDRLREDYGLSFTIDYSAAFTTVSNTLGEEDSFGSGAIRFFGQWDLVGRESGNTGSFIWKIENRHKYTDIPPSGTASEIGYAGSILPVFSDQGGRLTNLYWKQNLNQGRLEIVAGMIDTTDWVDLYALAAPWTGFFNFAMATGGAAMDLPDNAALGVYVNAMLTDNLYVIGGVADRNADSSHPFDGFDTFFNDREYTSTIELGWTTSPDRFYFDNTHITYWHADERKVAGVPGGWGLSFSYEHSFDDRWLPFFRAGYAKDGGTILQKTIGAGFGHHWGENNSLLGFGINWGEPNEDTYGEGLDDQYTFELFCRLQVMKNLQITPDIQYIIDPALNLEADHSWVLGLRARLIF